MKLRLFDTEMSQSFQYSLNQNQLVTQNLCKLAGFYLNSLSDFVKF